jgi:hypothetical protein
MINDSDIGYTFWDEMWNDNSDEQRKRQQRGEAPLTNDTAEDDLA